MRKTLIINSGSSSLKFKLYNMPQYEVICEGIIERIGQEANFVLKYQKQKHVIEQTIITHEVAINLLLEQLKKHKLIDDLAEITKVGHRVVQGGEIFTSSTIVNEQKLEQIYELQKLAPLHNKANADGIKIFMKLLPNAQNIAVFDTEFHQSMPKESYIYPVPYSWYKKHGVRRYGMHGTSHKFVANKISQLEGVPLEDLKIINCHLGNGASLCAIKDAKVLTTSMGLTPLAGIMMGTRSGDIDPSIIEYMAKELNKDVFEITHILNNESGMLGVSEFSNDCRDLAKKADDGDMQAIFTFELYVTRLVETIGAYAARMGGLDIISFTGGIGENNALIRKMTLDALDLFNIKIDNSININSTLHDDRVITLDDSSVKVWVVNTDEEYQIALEAEKF